MRALFERKRDSSSLSLSLSLCEQKHVEHRVRVTKHKKNVRNTYLLHVFFFFV